MSLGLSGCRRASGPGGAQRLGQPLGRWQRRAGSRCGYPPLVRLPPACRRVIGLHKVVLCPDSVRSMLVSAAAGGKSVRASVAVPTPRNGGSAIARRAGAQPHTPCTNDGLSYGFCGEARPKNERACALCVCVRVSACVHGRPLVNDRKVNVRTAVGQCLLA